MKLSVRITVLLIIGLAITGGSSYAGSYTMGFLDAAGGYSSAAYDINDSGQVAGIIQTNIPNDPATRGAVLWNDDESAPIPLDGNDSGSTARVVNDSGLVVGTHVATPGIVSTFLWSLAGGITDIGASFAIQAINDSGTMVGSASSPEARTAPVVVNSAGETTFLDNITGGSGGEACGINDSGYIAGASYTPVWGGHACLWHVGDSPIDLGTFGGTWSSAFGINDSGQVVGVYGGDDGCTGWFVWKQGVDPTLITDNSLFDEGNVFGVVAINNNGVVVGNSVINGKKTILTWTADVGYSIVGEGEAKAINNLGVIVGAFPESITDSPQAVVWTPLPEPSSLLALLTGLCGVGGMMWRRRAC